MEDWLSTIVDDEHPLHDDLLFSSAATSQASAGHVKLEQHEQHDIDPKVMFKQESSVVKEMITETLDDAKVLMSLLMYTDDLLPSPDGIPDAPFSSAGLPTCKMPQNKHHVVVKSEPDEALAGGSGIGSNGGAGPMRRVPMHHATAKPYDTQQQGGGGWLLSAKQHQQQQQRPTRLLIGRTAGSQQHTTLTLVSRNSRVVSPHNNSDSGTDVGTPSPPSGSDRSTPPPNATALNFKRVRTPIHSRYQDMTGYTSVTATTTPRNRSKMHDLAVQHNLISEQLQDGRQNGGVVQLSAEEKRTLLQEGFAIPSRLPLSKAELDALKFVRRKIKNKLSAQESRRKRKDYIGSLEQKLEGCESENDSLRDRVRQLESSNRTLSVQLGKLSAQLRAAGVRVDPAVEDEATDVKHERNNVCLAAFIMLFAVALPLLPSNNQAAGGSMLAAQPQLWTMLPTPWHNNHSHTAHAQSDGSSGGGACSQQLWWWDALTWGVGSGTCAATTDTPPTPQQPQQQQTDTTDPTALHHQQLVKNRSRLMVDVPSQQSPCAAAAA